MRLDAQPEVWDNTYGTTEGTGNCSGVRLFIAVFVVEAHARSRGIIGRFAGARIARLRGVG